MSEHVSSSELTQLHSMIGRERSLQRQGHRRRRRDEREGEEDNHRGDGGWQHRRCRWVESGRRESRVGLRLMEDENKKQLKTKTGVEVHDHNQRVRN